MNYYEHHLGDYAQATVHLSMLEDAAYSRMLRWYYAEERPLPADERAICRIVRAASKPERDAVKAVLADFFELQTDGYHQRRCDAEIARFQDKQSKARRSANARWNGQPTHSGGNANAHADASANASPDAMRTHSEGNALQSPVSSLQFHPPTPRQRGALASPRRPGPETPGSAVPSAEESAAYLAEQDRIRAEVEAERQQRLAAAKGAVNVVTP